MTEKKNFVYKFFCHLFNISDIFLWKNCIPLQKSHPSLSQQPHLKIKILPSPTFSKFSRRHNPPAEKGWSAHYAKSINHKEFHEIMRY